MDLRARFAPGFPTWKSHALTLLLGTALPSVACCQTVPYPAEQVAPSKTATSAKPGVALAQEFSILLVSDPGHPAQGGKQLTLEASLRQAEKAFEDGRFEEALAKCREALEIDPKSAHAYYLLGMIEDERGAHEAAKQALLESVRLGPSHIATHVYLARTYLVAKDWRAAEKEFATAISLGDSSGASRYGLALALLAQSREAEALPHLLAAVEAGPKDPETLYTLTATEFHLKYVDNARRHLTRLEALSPHDPWLSYRLGKLLLENHILKEADAEFERVEAHLAEASRRPAPPDVKLSDLYLQIAQLHFHHRDYQGALQYLSKIDPISREQNFQAATLHLKGAACLAIGRVKEAQEELREAVQMDSSKPDYLVRLIWAELLAGNIKEASAAAAAARSKWSEVPNIEHMSAMVERENAPERVRIPFSAEWHLKGEGLVCCPCSVPCPCRSNGPPTHGHCENTGVFRIAQGHYGNVSLDGFTFVSVSGSMDTESELPSSLYVDTSATDSQLIALERLLQSFNPLVPFMLLNVKHVPISFVKSPEGKGYEVKIPQVLQIKIQRQLNARGEPLLPTAALDYFSNTLEYARNLTYKIWGEDGNLKWDYSRRQANYRMIELDSSDYRNRTMLIQYADWSGFFTKRQFELIKSLKLPTLARYPRSAK